MAKARVAIVYHSRHHHNTEKLVRSYAQGIDFYPVDNLKNANLADYDLVGFASGINGGRMAPEIENVMKRDTKKLKQIFLVYTSGTEPLKYGEKVRQRAEKLGLSVCGVFGCRGFNTFGPFKLIGGTSKGHPNTDDLYNYQKFIQQITETK